MEDDSSDSEGEGTVNAFALVSLYSRPDRVLLEESSKTLWACKYLGSENLRIVSVKALRSVVSMQPLPFFPHEEAGKWFVVQKPGIDNAIMTGHEEDMDVI